MSQGIMQILLGACRGMLHHADAHVRRLEHSVLEAKNDISGCWCNAECSSVDGSDCLVRTNNSKHSADALANLDLSLGICKVYAAVLALHHNLEGIISATWVVAL